jgi:hypothetical protein
VIGVLDANGTNANQGQFTVLQPASGSSQAEDWVIDFEDTVSNLYQAGLVSAAVNLHYGNDVAYEFEYVPDGAGSGLCLGTPGTARNGTTASLQPCGASAQTIWIADSADQYKRQIPLIAGTDTDFSYPYVLTANSTGINLNVTMLTGGNGIIENGQYWAFEYGVLP